MKILKSICKALLFGSIFVCLFPLAVFAENGYLSLTALECYPVYLTNSSGQQNNRYSYNFNTDVKAIAYRNNENKIGYCFMSEEPFKMSNKSGITGCYANATMKNADNYTANDYNFYYSVWPLGDFSINFDTVHVGNEILPFAFTNVDYTDNLYLEDLYDYIFNGVTPPEPINWGSVRDPEYSTRIAGSGSAAKQNVDVLRWNKEYDTNGNDISECEIEIQAVPGSWSDSTLQGLLNQAVNAFNSTGVQPVTLDTVPADDGIYNCSWQRIINTLNWNFDYLLARETQAGIWEKYGWYYRIRLLSPDDYVGQWQTLYTPLSSGAQDSETVINHNSFDMSVNQVYQNLTQLNNNTSITIVYNETDYTVQNPTNGTEPTGGTNLWDILKELLNGIFQILAKLGDLVVGLIDNLFDLFRSLFTPPEVSNEVNNDINININNYITENQPGLQDQQLHLHQIFDDLDSISSAYSSGGNCVLQWDDVSMDLSVFNAGNVTFIPGGTYDFKAAFMQLLAGFGMTYATYQMLVSGVIYILLFVLISHKVKGFLKKT